MTQDNSTVGEILTAEEMIEVRRDLAWAISSESTAKAMGRLLYSHHLLAAQLAEAERELAEARATISELRGLLHE